MASLSSSEEFAQKAKGLGYQIGLVNSDAVRGAKTIDGGEPFSFMHQPMFFATREGERWNLSVLPEKGQLSEEHESLTIEEALELLSNHI